MKYLISVKMGGPFPYWLVISVSYYHTQTPLMGLGTVKL